MTLQKLGYIAGCAACICLTFVNVVTLAYIEANRDMYPANIKIIALFSTPIAFGIVLGLFGMFSGGAGAKRED